MDNTNVPDWLKDPRNLATGLVFLAALAQPRPQGVRTGAAIGQNALGALAFRGNLDTNLQQERNREEDRRNQQLLFDRQEEQRQIQNRAQQQQIGLQEKGLSQAERLAQQQMQTQRDLATTVRPETPEEAQLKGAMARYYDRMPKAGAGGGEKDFRTQMFEDLFKTQWTQEVQQAALEGRQPDVLKILPQMSNLMAGLQALPEGMRLERDSNGVLSVVIPGNPSGAPPSSAPITTPGQAAGQAVSSGVPLRPEPSVPLNLLETAPQKPSQPRGPRGSNAPDPYKVLAEYDEKTTLEQLKKLPDEKLIAFLKDPRITKQQAIAIRKTLKYRGRPEVLPGTDIY